MPLTPGDILQTRYRVVSLLGQGGMGAVYRAWDLRLKVHVALKEQIPQPGLAAGMLAQLRQQFEQEAVTLARLSHPHLVRVTDFFEEGGNAYLVMDFLEGESLGDRIAREGRIPEAQVLSWARQLLDALAYCHSQGIVHRDIKPQNILLRPDGQAVLVDFGLVKLWNPNDPLTRTVLRGMGTPEYAPPEQYGKQGQTTDPRSDLYSLGATLYHALTGQAPPTASDRMADPHLFQPVRALNPQVSVATEMAIMRALEAARDGRWPDAGSMQAALDRSDSFSRVAPLQSATPVLSPAGGTGTAVMPTPQPVSPPLPVIPQPTRAPVPAQSAPTPPAATAAIPTSAFWTPPYGEPVWVEIPAGEFWMGSEKGRDREKPVHKVHLDRYWIAKTPITNAQYRLFVEATKHAAPRYWENGQIPRGLESHPVVEVTWHDAIAYCRWLSQVTGKSITLPSEAEWEKAARGDKDKREYPWGDTFDKDQCNSGMDVGRTTPVGKYSPAGDSPFGCADMAGNVWEWTRSLMCKDWINPEFKYPYRSDDGRENPKAGDDVYRVLRGGSFYFDPYAARCSFRLRSVPLSRRWDGGFRVVVAPSRP